MTPAKNKNSDEKIFLKISAAGKTDQGKVRQLNEDNFSIHEDLGLYIVSDGVGGLRAGDKASEIVTKVLPIKIREGIEEGVDDIKSLSNLLGESISYISRQINKYSNTEEGVKGAGATVVCTLIRDNKLIVAHMGDSRAYRFRDGELEPLTLDHSIVAMLLYSGQITKEEAEKHPARHTITRYVGMKGKQKPELSVKAIKDGDLILLCTDGLTGMVDEEEIISILSGDEDDVEMLSAGQNLDRTCSRLVDAANHAGGRDNITVVLIQVECP